MQTITMCNDNIMVKEIIMKDEEKISASGIYIPEEILEDSQVAQGHVVRSNSDNYNIGDIVLFHKVMPVDVDMKIDEDKALTRYFFIQSQDVICKITEDAKVDIN